jgi:hypothetical protein
MIVALLFAKDDNSLVLFRHKNLNYHSSFFFFFFFFFLSIVRDKDEWNKRIQRYSDFEIILYESVPISRFNCIL